MRRHPREKFLPFPVGDKRGLVLRVLLLLLFLLVPWLTAGRAENRGDAKLGKTVYLKNCVACHGQKGGGLGFRSTLSNFTDAKTMAAKTDAELFDKISAGGKGTGMPAWNTVLTEEERWNVLAYIRTFSNP